MMEYDRTRLKTAAKQAMKYQRPHPMLITLLFSVIVNFGARLVDTILGAASGSSTMYTMYAQALLEYGEPERAIQHVMLSFGPQRLALALFAGVFIAGILASLWTGLMRTGYSGFCLEMVRGRQPQTGALFGVFPQWAGVLLTQFVVGLFRGLWTLLFGAGLCLVIFVATLLFSQVLALFLLVLIAAYIAFILGLVWITLRYAMVDFLIADQGLTGMDAIRESRRLMQGNTGKLFFLNLSFLGWYLLEAAVMMGLLAAALATILSAGPVYDPTELMGRLAASLLGILGVGSLAAIGIGILNLWLTPYITGAQALFYDWLRGVDSRPAGGYGYGPGGGWGQPYPPQQPPTSYNWEPTPGPSSGTGIGSGPQDGGTPPKPPKSPKDDPWD